jgi:hypothetical protein
MKHWVVVLALGATPACQTGEPPTSVTQSQQAVGEDCFGVANFCQVSKTALSPWKTGDPFPQSSPSTVLVMMRVAGSLWQAYGADPSQAKLMWGRTMKSADVGAFQELASALKMPYGGVRPPPPPPCPPDCGDPLPGYVVAAALRIAGLEAAAQADRAACPVEIPK